MNQQTVDKKELISMVQDIAPELAFEKVVWLVEAFLNSLVSEDEEYHPDWCSCDECNTVEDDIEEAIEHYAIAGSPIVRTAEDEPPVKPCPYCGERPLLRDKQQDGYNLFNCGTENCHASYGWSIFSEWNKRHSLTTEDERLCVRCHEDIRIHGGDFCRSCMKHFEDVGTVKSD